MSAIPSTSIYRSHISRAIRLLILAALVVLLWSFTSNTLVRVMKGIPKGYRISDSRYFTTIVASNRRNNKFAKRGPSTLYTDKIYCISMKDRVDRRARVKSLFDHTGLDVEFSMGVEVNPQMKGYKELNAGKPHIRDNQKGCWLSHVKVWRDIIRNGHEISTIFEDDVDFSMNIHYKIHYALDLMNGTATKNNISQEFVPKDLKPGYKDPGWDLMFFGHCSIFEDRGIFVVNDIDFVPATKPYCNHGYLISLVGARRLIDLMGEMIVGPLDLAIIREVEKTDPKEKLRAFSFRVPIAKQRRDLYKNDEGVRAPIFEAPEGSLLDHVTKYSRLYTHKEIVNMGL